MFFINTFLINGLIFVSTTSYTSTDDVVVLGTRKYYKTDKTNVSFLLLSSVDDLRNV